MEEKNKELIETVIKEIQNIYYRDEDYNYYFHKYREEYYIELYKEKYMNKKRYTPRKYRSKVLKLEEKEKKKNIRKYKRRNSFFSVINPF